MILSPQEAIAYLRLENRAPLRTLDYYRRKGELQGVRLGRRYCYRKEDIDSFVASKAQRGPLVLAPPPSRRSRYDSRH